MMGPELLVARDVVETRSCGTHHNDHDLRTGGRRNGCHVPLLCGGGDVVVALKMNLRVRIVVATIFL